MVRDLDQLAMQDLLISYMGNYYLGFARCYPDSDCCASIKSQIVCLYAIAEHHTIVCHVRCEFQWRGMCDRSEREHRTRGLARERLTHRKHQRFGIPG